MVTIDILEKLLAETVKSDDENPRDSNVVVGKVVEYSADEIKESLQVLKTEDDFDRETAIICLNNAMLECKVEEMEGEMPVLNNKIQGLEERLKEEQKMKKRRRDY